MRKLDKSPKPTKVPPKLPTYAVKAMWDSTAQTYRIPAATSEAAWEKCWKMLAKTEGGMSCLKVVVLGRVA